MTKIFSKDYHDYVFKDGKFIGDFEDMYKHSEEVPWNQDARLDTWHGKIGQCVMESAFDDGSIKNIIEVGCGYGYILSRLKVDKEIALTGFDISSTAIAKAQQLHPNHKFFVDDLVNLAHEEHYDLVICKENLWYVIDHIDKAIENLARLQQFPAACESSC